MNLLENPLILKYFGCPPEHNHYHQETVQRCKESLAFKILTAMQEPVKKGDRYIVTHDDGNTWSEDKRANEFLPTDYDGYWHPNVLRLPDSFQRKDCEDCGTLPGITDPKWCKCSCHGKKDPVEEKIQEIVAKADDFDQEWIKTELASLVNLVRKEK